MRTQLGLATLICILIFGGNPARAQQKGQYIPGQQGLNAGVLPDPGFTYANMTINYSADMLRNGDTHEKVYDVVWGGDRKADAKTSKLSPVGDTVDVPNATYTNTIGASELIKVWKDPEFGASQRAFYYVRVLEIPTPRWTAYDANYFGIKMPPEVPMKGQERAYISPIWYTPAK